MDVSATPGPAPRPSRLRRLLGALAGWLRAVPIADPVERNNAAMMQLLLIFMGLYQPLVMIESLWRGAGSELIAVVPAAINTLAMWVCFLILRYGHLRWSAGLFVAVTLSLVGYGYLRWGLQAQMWTQLSQLLPVLVGGLVLSRRTLWFTVACLASMMLVGAWRDAGAFLFEPSMAIRARDRALHMILALVAIAAVLDLAVAALRESLEALRLRNRELARTRDRLQLEMQEKERSREQLVHAQKMEAAGRLASGVAHDFNHLLGLVMGYAGQGRDLDRVEDLKKALAGAESAARRAAAVSRKLLDFSRREPARMEALDAGQALAQMQPMLRQTFPAQVEVELDLPGRPRPVWLDRAQLELVVLNLAANACQAMPDGGRFRIELPDHDPDFVDILVSDTGPGMSEQVRARCFEPFFTTKPSGQGTGLGLAVAANMVEAWGGRITVDSAPGRGSVFRIRVPRRRATATAADVEPSAR